MEKTNISNSVSIRSNATILPVKIFSNVAIGAGSVVAKNILEPLPLHLQPALEVQFSNINLAVTETLANEIISIPIHPHLTDKEVLTIANEFMKVALPDES